MHRRFYFIFIAASFALLVAAPGRLAYGFVLVLEMNLLALSSSAFCLAIKKLDLEYMQDVLSLSFIVFFTILYKQIVILFSPVIALNLGFMMFLPAVSIFLIGNVFSERVPSPSNIFKQIFVFSAFAFIFFLLRDILGYGTISFPVKDGVFELYLFDSYSTSFLSFFATVPGALLLVVFCMAALLSVQYKLNIIGKSGEENGDD